jgi:hypothetical protein
MIARSLTREGAGAAGESRCRAAHLRSLFPILFRRRILPGNFAGDKTPGDTLRFRRNAFARWVSPEVKEGAG